MSKSEWPVTKDARAIVDGERAEMGASSSPAASGEDADNG